MHDAGKIMVGLVVFLGVVASPAWYRSVEGGEGAPPDLKTAMAQESCVAPTDYMRSFHMDLLNDWRDEAVRDGDRTYVGLGGKIYDKNLASTCIRSCHSSRREFCDRCHEYVGAEPYCWECHDHPPGEAVTGADGRDPGSAAGARG